MANGQTIIKYNGITLWGVQTQMFEQSPKFDESDTNYMYESYRVRVVAHVHGDETVTTVNTFPHVGSGGGSASLQMIYIRSSLNHPRGTFEMLMGCDTSGNLGVPILQCGASYLIDNKQFSDRNNGPKPRVISIQHVTGDNLFRVEWECELAIAGPNADATQSNRLVLSNRWTCSDTVDQNFYTTRQFRGVLRLRDSDINPHSFRAYCIPPLMPGMQRQAMTFEASVDGLSLHYTIVDRESAFAAPWPATHWDIRHTEETGDNGVSQIAACDVTIGGDRDANKKDLFRIAAVVIESRLAPFGKGFENVKMKQKLLHFSVVDHVTNNATNVVSMSMRVQKFVPLGERPRGEEQIGGGLIRRRVAQATSNIGTPISGKTFQKLVQQFERFAENPYDNNLSRNARRGDQFLEKRGPVAICAAFAAHMQTFAVSKWRQGSLQTPPESICDGLLVENDDQDDTNRFRGDGECSPWHSSSNLFQDCHDVNVRIVPVVEEKPAYWLDDDVAERGPYTYYETSSNYTITDASVSLPIAGAQLPYEFDKSKDEAYANIPEWSRQAYLSPPQVTREIHVSAERLGETPEIVEPKETIEMAEHGLVMKRKRFQIKSETPRIGGNGQVIRRVEAKIEYSVEKWPDALVHEPNAAMSDQIAGPDQGGVNWCLITPWRQMFSGVENRRRCHTD